MITRIVRMEFQEGKVSDFLKLFNTTYPRIRFFEGCHFLELHRDKELPYVFYTLSHWESPDHLQIYRESELFAETWKITKQYFSGKPQAWSLVNEVENRITP